MSYEKKDLKSFKASLDGSDYETATGARRAVGRMKDWSEADRDKARKMIDVHFGTEAAPASKPTKKGKAAKKASKKPVPRAAKAAKEEKASDGEKPKKRAARASTAVVTEAGDINEKLKFYDNVIQSLDKIKDQVDVKQALDEAKEGIRALVRRVNELNGATAEVHESAPAEQVAQSNGTLPEPFTPTAPRGLAGALPSLPGASVSQ